MITVLYGGGGLMGPQKVITYYVHDPLDTPNSSQLLHICKKEYLKGVAEWRVRKTEEE